METGKQLNKDKLEKYLQENSNENINVILGWTVARLKAVQQCKVDFENNPHYSSYLAKAQQSGLLGQTLQKVIEQQKTLAKAEKFLSPSYLRNRP